MISQKTEGTTVTKANSLGLSDKLPSLSSIVSGLIIIFLIYAFFSGLSMKFYASIVFFFYSLFKSMWISVVCLGVFQTLLLVPFRIVKLIKQHHIQEFQKNINKIKDVKKRQETFRTTMKTGRKVALFYSIDFFVQLVSYISIGRLFLTDFYSKALDPKLLFSFVPYPDYPIMDRWFKIPYPWFNDTKDLGMQTVFIVWLALFVFFFIFYLAKNYYFKNREKISQNQAFIKSKSVLKYLGANILFFFLISFIIIRYLPIDWHFRIFSRDIAHPSPTFNTITATVTFATVMWFGVHKIMRKAELARKHLVPEDVIEATQKEMFKETLLSSILIGAAAYFITNQIPCAFELSIFTFEIIALSSPLTLDKIILRTMPKPKNN